MPEFSACYFCGTALDAPLAEYPVVPDALQPAPDQQRTIVLCPTCRRKVGAVVDTVIDAIDDQPGEDSIQRELDDASERSAATSASSDPLSNGRETSATDRADESAEIESPTEPESTTSSDAGGFEFQNENEDRTTDAPTDEASQSSATTDEPATEPDDGADETTDDGNVDATADDGNANATTDDGSSEDAADEEPRMTALEYNKVMRLLQNRDFPVDHQEFKIVATNAYELSEEEFDTVIQAAEQRDLIALDGDQIVDGSS